MSVTGLPFDYSILVKELDAVAREQRFTRLQQNRMRRRRPESAGQKRTIEILKNGTVVRHVHAGRTVLTNPIRTENVNGCGGEPGSVMSFRQKADAPRPAVQMYRVRLEPVSIIAILRLMARNLVASNGS